ncbi:MAG: MerR family transcriptional regulator [Bacilli bacterium]|nr:MerR family transcriptional regulator [Bacilli bacterium]
MNYTIGELSILAGVSKRTLRYYDQVGILSPNHINESGYRVYTSKEVDLLQQIMFFKEFDITLSEIKEMLLSSNFDQLTTLKKHKINILKKKERIETLLYNLNETIDSIERNKTMKDSKKFEGLKEKLIADNNEKYGSEIKLKYGEVEIEESNDKIRKMSKADYAYAEELGNRILKQLTIAFQTNNPNSEASITLAKMHQEWIQIYWPTYSIEAHKGLVKMYVEDERFASYYDKVVQGGAVFIRDVVLSYLN